MPATAAVETGTHTRYFVLSTARTYSYRFNSVGRVTFRQGYIYPTDMPDVADILSRTPDFTETDAEGRELLTMEGAGPSGKAMSYTKMGDALSDVPAEIREQVRKEISPIPKGQRRADKPESAVNRPVSGEEVPDAGRPMTEREQEQAADAQTRTDELRAGLSGDRPEEAAADAGSEVETEEVAANADANAEVETEEKSEAIDPPPAAAPKKDPKKAKKAKKPRRNRSK